MRASRKWAFGLLSLALLLLVLLPQQAQAATAELKDGRIVITLQEKTSHFVIVSKADEKDTYLVTIQGIGAAGMSTNPAAIRYTASQIVVTGTAGYDAIQFGKVSSGAYPVTLDGLVMTQGFDTTFGFGGMILEKGAEIDLTVKGENKIHRFIAVNMGQDSKLTLAGEGTLSLKSEVPYAMYYTSNRSDLSDSLEQGVVLMASGSRIDVGGKVKLRVESENALAFAALTGPDYPRVTLRKDAAVYASGKAIFGSMLYKGKQDGYSPVELVVIDNAALYYAGEIGQGISVPAGSATPGHALFHTISGTGGNVSGAGILGHKQFVSSNQGYLGYIGPNPADITFEKDGYASSRYAQALASLPSGKIAVSEQNRRDVILPKAVSYKAKPSDITYAGTAVQVTVQPQSQSQIGALSQVLLNDKALKSGTDYLAEKQNNGSLLLTIYTAALDGLAAGDHEVSILFLDGQAGFTLSVPKSSATAVIGTCKAIKQTNLYSSATASSRYRLGKLAKNATAELLSYEANGMACVLYKGQVCYVSMDNLSISFDDTQAVMVTAKTYLCEKASNSSRYRHSGLSKNELVQVVGREGSWWIVEQDGKQYYVRCDRTTTDHDRIRKHHPQYSGRHR